MTMKAVEVRMDPEMHQQIRQRAQARGCSANEWMRLALGAALSGQTAVAITTTSTTTIKREL